MNDAEIVFKIVFDYFSEDIILTIRKGWITFKYAYENICQAIYKLKNENENEKTTFNLFSFP